MSQWTLPQAGPESTLSQPVQPYNRFRFEFFSFLQLSEFPLIWLSVKLTPFFYVYFFSELFTSLFHGVFVFSF